MAAAKRAVALKTPTATAQIDNGTVNMYVKVFIGEKKELAGSYSVDMDGHSVEDVSCSGNVMEICEEGIRNILDLTDQCFENTVVAIRKLREEYKKINK